MNRTLLSSVLLTSTLLLSASAAAGIIVQDGFAIGPTAYTEGVDLNGQGPAVTGFTGNWSVSFNRYDTTAGSAITGFFADEQAGGLIRSSPNTGPQTHSRAVSTGAPNNTASTSNEYWSAFSLNWAGTLGGAGAGYTLESNIGTNLSTQTSTNTGVYDGMFVARGNNPFGGAVSANTDYLFVTRLTVTDSSALSGTPGGIGLETFDAWVFDLPTFTAWNKTQAGMNAAALHTYSSGPLNLIYKNTNDGSDGSIRVRSAQIFSPRDSSNGTRIDEYRLSTSIAGLSIDGFVVPEPGSFVLFALGFSLLIVLRRR